MAGTMSSLGKFKTYCLVRRMLAVFCEVRERPRVRRWLRHQAEDMGTAFREPSELRFIIRTIGVPNRGLRERVGGGNVDVG